MILMKPYKSGVSVYSCGSGESYKTYAEINENSPSEVLARFFSDVLIDLKNNDDHEIRLYVDFKIKKVNLSDVKNFMREINSSTLDNMNYWYFSTGNWQAPDQGEYDLHDIIHEIWHERGEE